MILKHHESIEWRPADIIAVPGFIEDHVKNWGEDLPVDMVIELDERVFEFSEFFKEKVFVEKAERVGVFHDN